MAHRRIIAVALAILGCIVWTSTRASEPQISRSEDELVTAHATFDTITLTWDSSAEGATYVVDVYHPEVFESSWFIFPFRSVMVGPQASYEVTVDDLESDRTYMI